MLSNIHEFKNQNKKNQESKLLLLYDDLEFSKEEAEKKFEQIFTLIEKQNPKEEETNNKTKKTKLNLNKVNNSIILENKYYKCEIPFILNPISNIEKIELKSHEGIIIYLTQNSIKNKIFSNISQLISENDNYSSCIILLDESREDLSIMKEYENFISEILDKYFEIICDCKNEDFYEDDGFGALNLSLHSSQWSSSQKNNNKKEDNKNLKNENNDKKKIDGKEYSKLNDEKEVDKLFNKIKEIKKINADPSISMEERRNNAEKAIYMLMDMFGLDENEEEEKEDEKEEK
jgi:hypothetical protein